MLFAPSGRKNIAAEAISYFVSYTGDYVNPVTVGLFPLLYHRNTTYRCVTFILEVGNLRQFLYCYKVLGPNKKKKLIFFVDQKEVATEDALLTCRKKYCHVFLNHMLPGELSNID